MKFLAALNMPELCSKTLKDCDSFLRNKITLSHASPNTLCTN